MRKISGIILGILGILLLIPTIAQAIDIEIHSEGNAKIDVQVSDSNEANIIMHSYSNNIEQKVTYENVKSGSIEQIVEWGGSEDVYKVNEAIASSGNFQLNWNNINQFIELINCGLIRIKQMIRVWKNSNGPFIMGSSFQENANTHAFKLLNGRSNDHSFDFAMLEWYARKFDIYPNGNTTMGILLTEWNLTHDNDTVVITYRAYNFYPKPMNATVKVFDITLGGFIYEEQIHLGIQSGCRNSIRIQDLGHRYALVLIGNR